MTQSRNKREGRYIGHSCGQHARKQMLIQVKPRALLAHELWHVRIRKRFRAVLERAYSQ